MHEIVNIFNYVTNEGTGSILLPGSILDLQILDCTIVVMWIDPVNTQKYSSNCTYSAKGCCTFTYPSTTDDFD